MPHGIEVPGIDDQHIPQALTRNNNPSDIRQRLYLNNIRISDGEATYVEGSFRAIFVREARQCQFCCVASSDDLQWTKKCFFTKEISGHIFLMASLRECHPCKQ